MTMNESIRYYSYFIFSYLQFRLEWNETTPFLAYKLAGQLWRTNREHEQQGGPVSVVVVLVMMLDTVWQCRLVLLLLMFLMCFQDNSQQPPKNGWIGHETQINIMQKRMDNINDQLKRKNITGKNYEQRDFFVVLENSILRDPYHFFNINIFLWEVDFLNSKFY